MRLLLAHPGAGISVSDVFAGYANGLVQLGHEVLSYRLDVAIDDQLAFMRWLWRRRGRQGPAPVMPQAVYTAGFWLLESAIRQRADWVIVVSGMFLHPDVLVLLRKAGVRVAAVLTESPYDDAEQREAIKFCDLAFTNERLSLPVLRTANPNTHYLPLGYLPEVHHPGPPAPDTPAHDVVFVGTGFSERVELLARVDWSGIDLGLYGQWGGLGSRSRLRRYVRGGLRRNADTVELYRAAKIGLNLYRQSMGWGRHAPRISWAASLNPRAYELAACGVFHLSDARSEVSEVFGDTVPTFETAAELEDQIRRYLADDAARAKLARQLPERVAAHSYRARARELVGHLEGGLRVVA